MNDERIRYNGECYCGAVTVTVVGPPVEAGYCHCRSCRKWHAAPVNAWSMWRKQDVEVSGDTTKSVQRGISERISCPKCGGCIANNFPGTEHIVVYPMTLADSDFNFEPKMHIFYNERVFDFNDGLPKFIGIGSDSEQVSEEGRTGWRRSSST